MKKLKLTTAIIHRMMDRAVVINRSCRDECRDFSIMTSPMRPDALLLRWITINLDNEDNPVQCYHYECFEWDGTPQHCSVHYSNADEANEFFWSLELHYRQPYAADHRLKTKEVTKTTKKDVSNK